MHASSIGPTGLSDPALKSFNAAPPSALPADFVRRSALSIGAGFGLALLLLARLSAGVRSQLKATQEERQWVRHSLELLGKKERAVRLRAFWRKCSIG